MARSSISPVWCCILNDTMCPCGLPLGGVLATGVLCFGGISSASKSRRGLWPRSPLSASVFVFGTFHVIHFCIILCVTVGGEMFIV